LIGLSKALLAATTVEEIKAANPNSLLYSPVGSIISWERREVV